MKPNRDELEKFDEEIDAALKIMNKAQPTTAMLSRVRKNLEAAAADEHRTNSGRLFWIPAISCAICVILFLVFTQSPQSRRKQTPTEAMVQVTATQHTAEGFPASARTLALPARSSGKRASSSRAIAQHSRQAHQSEQHATKLLSYPLTRQEKLLLQFAQTAAPEDLQALNPEHQAAVEAEEKAKFAAYLNPRSASSIKKAFN